jgi:hypothetical protein
MAYPAKDYSYGGVEWTKLIWSSARPYERSTLALIAEQQLVLGVATIPKLVFDLRWSVAYGNPEFEEYLAAFATSYSGAVVTLDLGFGDADYWQFAGGVLFNLGVMRGSDNPATRDNAPYSRTSTIAGRDW